MTTQVAKVVTQRNSCELLGAKLARTEGAEPKSSSLLGHADAERRFRAVEENVDVVARESEVLCDVLSVAFLQQTHHHDRALAVAETADAALQTNAVLGVCEQRVG